jgi:ABC-type Fe3+-hydroxamate transport system substrate-binding protein
MRYKKLFALLLALALVCGSLSGCASERQTAPAEPTVPFTDSLGRTVDIPETLTRVAPSGTVASMFLATIAPEYMTTINAVVQPVQISRPAPDRSADDRPDVRQQVDAESGIHSDLRRAGRD